MKTFELFCENKRSADLFWECAKIFREVRWEPVHFTIGMMEAWSESEEDKNKRDFLLETLRICDEEILLEQNPFASRFQKGYQRGTQRKPGSPISYGGGRLAGAAAEKAGQVGGWLKDQWRDIKGSFAQGVGGEPHDPNAYAGGQQQQAQDDDTIPFNQQGDDQVPPEDKVDVKQGAQYFDQLLTMMQRAGMDQQYIRTLKGLRDTWVNNSGGQSSSVASQMASGGAGSAIDNLTRSREAGSNAAQAYQSAVQGATKEPPAQQSVGSMQQSIATLSKEIEQAEAEGDTNAAEQMRSQLKDYQQRLRKYQRRAKKGGLKGERDVAGSFVGMSPGAFQNR